MSETKTTRSKKVDYTMETRPLPASKLCKALSLWLALGLNPESFSENVPRDMMASYFLQVKKQEKDPNTSLTDKQYSALYHVYEQYKVSQLFDFDAIKFICVDISKFGTLEIKSQSGQPCSQWYFETKEDKILTIDEFKEKYKHLIKHHKFMTKLPPTRDEEFD